MLKGIDPLLSPELLKLLAEMGHDDAVVLADANFTAMSLGAGKPVLRLPGVGMARTMEAVASVLPLAEDVPCPVAYMQVGGTEPGYRSALQRETLAVLARHGLREGQAEAVERYAFYERVRRAYAIVVTGELEPWGNFILRKGVLGQTLRPLTVAHSAAVSEQPASESSEAVLHEAAAEPTEAPRLRPRGSNQMGMRQFNERVVLQALRVHGSCAKAELARLTGLTAQTIGLITARLDEDQLLIREAPVRGRVGQPSVPLGLNPDGAFAIGIKIGRRSTDWLLVDFMGRVRQRLVLDYAFPDAATLLPAIRRNLDQLLDGLGALRSRVVGVGVAAPFQLGGWHRMLGLTEAQAQNWNQIDLAMEVQAMTDLPVSFAKDTSAACVAELLQGRGRDLHSFLYLFMDTFVGGGLVIDSHLHRGANGNAGAVASLPLQVAAPGVRELPPQLISQASLWELEQRFREQALDPMAAYDERALQPPWLPHTHEWVGRAAFGLAHCIVSGTVFLDVDAVVLDGAGAPGLMRELCARTTQALRSYNWEGLQAAPRLELGSIGSDARALGGALLPLHACFAPDREVFLKG